MGNEALRVSGLSVNYGPSIALRDVSLIARRGEVTAVVGGNGAGKSTLINAIYGSIPGTGDICLDGASLVESRPQQRAKAGIAIVPQGRQLFPKLTVRENLLVYAEFVNAPRDAVTQAFERYPRLAARSNRMAGVLSGGEQQMLVLSRALLRHPRVLLLDEVTTGLAPKIVHELLDEVRAWCSDGLAVLATEPAAVRLRSIIDRGYVLQRGRIVAESGDGADLDDFVEETMRASADLDMARAGNGRDLS